MKAISEYIIYYSYATGNFGACRATDTLPPDSAPAAIVETTDLLHPFRWKCGWGGVGGFPIGAEIDAALESFRLYVPMGKWWAWRAPLKALHSLYDPFAEFGELIGAIETFYIVTENGQILENTSGAHQQPYPYNRAVSRALELAAERNEPVYITDEHKQRLAIVTDNAHTPL